MNQRQRPRVGVLVIGVILALFLAACSNGEVADESEQAVDDATTDATSSDDGPRVAILLPGNITDRGFNATGEVLAQRVEDELGGDATFTETVSVPDQADVYRQFANEGYDVVVGWGGQFTDGALAVGEEFPNVNFLVASSTASNGENVGSFDTAIEEWQYVVGYAMGLMSESGTVGQISGQCFPSTAANINGTEQGALAANEGVTFLETFTGDFNDPTAARDAATAMIEQGADVLTTNLNDAQFGVFEAAAAADVPVLVIGEWLEDLNEVAPEVIAASSNKTYVPFALQRVEDAAGGVFDGGTARFEMPSSSEWGPALFDTELLDDEIHQESIRVQDEIASGAITVERDEQCP